MRVALSALAALTLLSSPSRASEREKVAVMPVRVLKSAAGKVERQALDEALLAAVQNLGIFSVIGRSDMNAVLGFEKQKDLLGCSDTSCFAEIGGALGVDKILEAQVGRADDAWLVSAKLINVKASTPTVDSRLADGSCKGGSSKLFEALPSMMRQLVSPAPPHVQPPAADATPAPKQQTLASGEERPAASQPEEIRRSDPALASQSKPPSITSLMTKLTQPPKTLGDQWYEKLPSHTAEEEQSAIEEYEKTFGLDATEQMLATLRSRSDRQRLCLVLVRKNFEDTNVSRVAVELKYATKAYGEEANAKADGEIRGSDVLVDGVVVGKTPANIYLPACASIVQIRDPQGAVLESRDVVAVRQKRQFLYVTNRFQKTSLGTSEIASDYKTGLVWQLRDKTGPKEASTEYCANLALDGKRWRSPTRSELAEVADATAFAYRLQCVRSP